MKRLGIVAETRITDKASQQREGGRNEEQTVRLRAPEADENTRKHMVENVGRNP